ncbi:hypothetical protein [Riemerella anatipestifer]|uniref:Lipoprotein n=1 Tax=Riemerella anatipestifer TaxID=34085 RepID=A0A1S7DUS0_RIEAN|nr:hypothetical protein [Riemerella anatipestifer]AQY22854.1 hypothetical protein AB406_1913 [Riemerella anatipestifer]
MKKLILLTGITLTTLVACKRELHNEDNELNELSPVAMCNKTYNTASTLNTFGTLIRTTCKPEPGIEVISVPANSNSQHKNSDLITLSASPKTLANVKTKATHFWFYGTDSKQLFKPITYARVFVFDIGDNKVEQAKQQIQSGNHYLGFDRGLFEGIYPYVVLNINHREINGKLQTSFNLENEVKRSLPVGKRIFIQFVVQKTPTEVPTFENSKFTYCDFVNEDNKAYPHYKVDLSDANLGYQGNSFYYVQ